MPACCRRAAPLLLACANIDWPTRSRFSMPSTMKALRKMHAARGLSFENAPVPSIGPADVLVRVRTASICGTDLHIYGWDRWSQGRIKPPVTLGHEFCGVVEQIGEEVTAGEAGGFVQAGVHGHFGQLPHGRFGAAPNRHNFRIHRIGPNRAVAGVFEDSPSDYSVLGPAR